MMISVTVAIVICTLGVFLGYFVGAANSSASEEESMGKLFFYEEPDEDDTIHIFLMLDEDPDKFRGKDSISLECVWNQKPNVKSR